MKRTGALLAFFSSVVIVLAFQNCGQPGQIAMMDPSTSDGPILSNSLEITTPLDNDTPTKEPMPEDVVSETPPTTEPMPDVVNNEDPLPEPMPDKEVDQPQVPPTTQTPEGDIKYGFNDTVHEGVCSKIEATDVMLTVAKVEVASNSSAVISIKDLQPALSVAKSSIKIEASASGDVREIRLVLADTGNYMMDIDELVYGLKTPSGQTSGFKIKLSSPVQVEAGKEYSLALNMDLSRQIVVAGKKCLLKPVIRSAVLAPL